jgi:hypothetical protein
MLDIRRNAEALSRSLIGHICQNRMFTDADTNDQFWSGAAGRSWDKAADRHLR